MNACTRLWLLTCAALLAVALLAVPALAQEDDVDVGDDVLVEETVDDEAEEGGRIVLADNPRDRLGLLLLTAMIVGGGIALTNGRKQLKGRNPQASGEFRWR